MSPQKQDREQTFAEINEWVQGLRDKLNVPTPPPSPIIEIKFHQ